MLERQKRCAPLFSEMPGAPQMASNNSKYTKSDRYVPVIEASVYFYLVPYNPAVIYATAIMVPQ